MFNSFTTGRLDDPQDWKDLLTALDPGVPDRQRRVQRSKHLLGVLNTFRDVGAMYFVYERVYVDSDFVQAYASFYHRTPRPQPKHCSRIHFFSVDLGEIMELTAKERAVALEDAGPHYLGFTVIRPVRHAPVSWALVSADALTASEEADEERADVLIRAVYEVHVLGARLEVSGIPVNEQDSRTGSCAQSSIWGAARHLHKRYGEPWRSVVDITNAALTPTDAEIATQLPHGSARLGRDAMVRAMKNLGIQPLVYSREPDKPWYEPPHRIVARYLDSGIPVIVGLERWDAHGNEQQHAVLAVGLAGHRAVERPDGKPDIDEGLGPTTYDDATHLLVNDDQTGPYKRMGIRRSASQATGGWLLEEATFILPALPDGVFMRPETAETIARDRIRMMIANRGSYADLRDEEELVDLLDAAQARLEPVEAAEDATGTAQPSEADLAERRASIEKFDAAKDDLVTRTYLTPGWKYVERMIRNDTSEFLNRIIAGMIFAKYVYVTEIGLRSEMCAADARERRIRGHVVVDPTANSYDEPPITHVPGLLLFASDPTEEMATEPYPAILILDDDGPYRPKIRGTREAAGWPTAFARSDQLEPGSQGDR